MGNFLGRVVVRLAHAITWAQGEIGGLRAHVAAAQVNGDVRSQSLNFSKYAGSTSYTVLLRNI
jgi:hypothetical protein